MKSILIISTCYDAESSHVNQWAQELHTELVKRDNISCFLYNAQYLCRSSKALDEAIERADFVVFYGHGTQDSWIALPDDGGSPPKVAAIPLVDSATVSVLNGKKVYAGCCWSLSGLGNNYIAQFPNGEYLGYQHQFVFERSNAKYFKEAVNLSVREFIDGKPAATVVNNLRAEWSRLKDCFYNGTLSGMTNAAMASRAADLNSQRVGSRP